MYIYIALYRNAMYKKSLLLQVCHSYYISIAPMVRIGLVVAQCVALVHSTK